MPKIEQNLNISDTFEDFYNRESNTMDLECSLQSIDLLIENLTRLETTKTAKSRIMAGYQKAYCFLKRYILTGQEGDAHMAAQIFLYSFQSDDTDVLNDPDFRWIHGINWLPGSITLSLIYTGQADEALSFTRDMVDRERNYRNLFRQAYMENRVEQNSYGAIEMATEAAHLVLANQEEMGLLNLRTTSYSRFHRISRNALLMEDANIGEAVVSLSNDIYHVRHPHNNLGYLLVIYNLLRKYHDEEALLFIDDVGFCDLVEATHQWKLLHSYERGLQRTLATNDVELFELSYEIPELAKELGALETKARKTWDEYDTFESKHHECFLWKGRFIDPDIDPPLELTLERARLHTAIESNRKEYYALIGRMDMITELLRQACMPIPEESFYEFRVH